MVQSSRSKLTIALSGASGLIGSALRERLRAQGHRVRPLVRRPAQNDDEISWEPERDLLQARDLEGLDALVHLAGENVGTGRWSDAKKSAIRVSRILGTSLIARRISLLERAGYRFRHHTLRSALERMLPVAA